MELVPIIYHALILGIAVLLLVVVVSFFFSRIRKENGVVDNIKQLPVQQSVLGRPVVVKNKIQTIQTNSTQQARTQRKGQPIIYPIDQFQPRQINVVRKQSWTDETRLSTNSRKNNANKPSSTSGNKPRYVIVNDEMRKLQNSGYHNENFWKSVL